jgi:hypothetical protein
MITLEAPVARMVVTSCCMPATCHRPRASLACWSPVKTQPSRQHGHRTPTGSLNRSKRVAGSFLYMLATSVHIAGEWSLSGIWSCHVAW